MPCPIAYVLPTRDRPASLGATLGALGELPEHEAQVIVLDNAAHHPARVPMFLENGLPVRLIHRDTNEGAAARNKGVRATDESCEWVVLLDDDSYPTDTRFLRALAAQPADVAAVAAELFVPARPSRGRPPPGGPASPLTISKETPREVGGLPEVFIGCGVAVRREAFLAAGGYDPAFGYYAEEYDLAAKMLLAGRRIVLDRRFRVAHHKDPRGRDMNVILHRLVRNNAWVAARYAPRTERRACLREVVARYERIAAAERAEAGYEAGVKEMLATVRGQNRTPMPPDLYDRFTGLACARGSLAAAHAAEPFATAALVDEGKNASLVRRALEELGVRLVEPGAAEALVIGTLSPGPLLDAYERRVAAEPRRRVVSPWQELIGASVTAAAPDAAAA